MKMRSMVAAAAFVAIAIGGSMEAKAEIDRYKWDFRYENIGYQILSETEKTVAVTQSFDIDFAPGSAQKVNYVRGGIGLNGFLMGRGLLGGPFVVIPQTVYDEEGTAYTVTELADWAINYVGMGTLVLPPTLKKLNNGISDVRTSQLYLPDGLKEIDGIRYCKRLKRLHIPWNVEVVRQNCLYACGFEYLFLPPSLKVLEDNVLAKCDSLELAMLSGVETMGEGCFSECGSYIWANLPETLKTMGAGCFNDCAALETVSLPWSEIKMDGCFNGCPSITTIEVLAVEPYPFPENSFMDVDRSKCELSVPVGSEEKYRAAEGWKEFYSIRGDWPAVEGASAAACRDDDFRAIGGKGYLRIINASDVPVEVFSLGGECVSTVNKAGVSEVQLPAGVYVVASPYGSRKVAVM